MEERSLDEIRNFLRVSDSLATAGQPTPEQFALIKQAGFQMVVNLATSASSYSLLDEKELVEKNGLQYIHIPVEWAHPKVEQARQFFQLLNFHQDKHIFVHCAMNMRVSAFLYLYRVLHLGISHDDAAKDLHRIWEPNETWQHFMEDVIQTDL